jgi:hypothetical protein
VLCRYHIRLMNCVIAFQFSLRTFKINFFMIWIKLFSHAKSWLLFSYFPSVPSHRFILETKKAFKFTLFFSESSKRAWEKMKIFLSQRFSLCKKRKTFEGNQFSLCSKNKWNVLRICSRVFEKNLRKSYKIVIISSLILIKKLQLKNSKLLKK